MKALNIIVTINRSDGEFQAKGEIMPFDGIQLGFDINTVPDNKEHRFDSPSKSQVFISQVSKPHDSLSGEITEFIDE